MAVKKTKTSELKKLIKDESQPIVIDMYADWCMPCRYSSPQFVKLSEKYENSKFVKVNVDEEPGIAQSFGVRGVPSFFILKGNKILASVVGADVKKVEKELNKVLKKKFPQLIAG